MLQIVAVLSHGAKCDIVRDTTADMELLTADCGVDANELIQEFQGGTYTLLYPYLNWICQHSGVCYSTDY
jgi:hypothetical protein